VKESQDARVELFDVVLTPTGSAGVGLDALKARFASSNELRVAHLPRFEPGSNKSFAWV
jgi:hypothetical protein